MIIFLRLFPKKFDAMAVWPFIITRNKSIKTNKTLFNHEKIHLRQQLEMLWFLFFIWYTFEFFIRFAIIRNGHQAYRAISFEREAYAQESNLDYLKKRTFWGFLKYL